MKELRSIRLRTMTYTMHHNKQKTCNIEGLKNGKHEDLEKIYLT